MDHATYLLAPFDQNAHLDAGANPASADGACHLFALKWCASIMKNRGAGAGARMLEMANNTAETRIKFAQFGARWDNEGGTHADGGFARMWGIKVDQLQRLGTRGQVGAQVSRESLTGFVYSFWFTGGEGHSIGVYRPARNRIFPGYVHVFEPNYGEYRMKKSRFAAWIRWIQRQYNFGAVNRNELRHLSLYNAPVVAGGRALPGMV